MPDPFLQVSGTAQRALEEFNTEFLTALASAPAEQWATTYGKYNPNSAAIKTTYPLSISAAGYVEAKGDFQMRSLYTRSISMKQREWTDGVAEKASIIEAPDFIDWNGEPARIAIEGARLPNRLVASLLNANANLGFYKDEDLGTDAAIPLFSNSHPVNIFDSTFGTFDNDHTFDYTTSELTAMLLRWRTKPGPNGKPAGRRMTHWLVPAALEERTKLFLQSDLMYNAMLAVGDNTNIVSRNIYQGAIQMVVCDELLDDDVIYAVDVNGPKPWVVQTGGAPEQIVFDKSSELYKQQFKIGVKYLLKANAGSMLPHAIERLTIDG